METIKKGNNQFYIGENAENALAKITFVPQGENQIIVDHTYVSEVFKGQGVGKLLVKKVVEYARENNKKIIPVCSYAKKVLTEGKEYRDILIED